MKKKKSAIPQYLYCEDAFSNFSMVTADLLVAEQWKNLSHAARMFYIVCATHKATAEQRQCLYNAIKEHYELLGDPKPDIDIQIMCDSYPKRVRQYNYFVIPKKHLEQYGYTSSRAAKLKRELIDKGFIRIAFNQKTPTKRWDKRVTIYQFISDWKQ